MRPKDYSRAAITAIVVALFAFAYIENPTDEMMKGALIAAFSMAVSYWLGSSKGSSDKSEQLEHITEQATGKPDDPVHTVPEVSDV